jgi:hypothetical protein
MLDSFLLSYSMDPVSVVSCFVRWSINMPNIDDKWAKICKVSFCTLAWCEIGRGNLEYSGEWWPAIGRQANDVAVYGIHGQAVSVNKLMMLDTRLPQTVVVVAVRGVSHVDNSVYWGHEDLHCSGTKLQMSSGKTWRWSASHLALLLLARESSVHFFKVKMGGPRASLLCLQLNCKHSARSRFTERDMLVGLFSRNRFFRLCNDKENTTENSGF